jgi:RNA polymerase sigma factor (TIGR02999 family)
LVERWLRGRWACREGGCRRCSGGDVASSSRRGGGVECLDGKAILTQRTGPGATADFVMIRSVRPSAMPDSNEAVDPARATAAELLPVVYAELRGLAQRYLRLERPGHSLAATALVHEAYLRIAGDRGDGWAHRAQFFAAAAEAMRRILIEHARARGCRRRGGDRQRITLTGVDLGSVEDLDQVLAVDEVLERFANADPRAAEIVRLRFYAGLSEEETAAVLGISDRSVRREWSYARAWLFEALHGSQ